MRLRLLLVVAVAGCGLPDTGMIEPTSFNHDDRLTESDVEGLLELTEQDEPVDLECDEVCTAMAIPYEYELIAITSCALTLDAEFTGVSNQVMGTLHCEGSMQFNAAG